MSMQIVEKSGEGLSRVYGVTIPAKDLADQLDARIAEITPTLNLKGFRPGKVPPGHVRKMYGKALMSEVVENTLNETTQKVLDEKNVRPAGQPELKPESDMDKVIAGGEDLTYEIALEVMPDFDPVDVATLELKRPTYEPTDAEIDESLADLAKQSRTFTAREEGAAAEDGDQLQIDFVGRIDGEAFDGGAATDADLTLGSGQFIPGFEEQLVGAKAGEERVVKVTFPEDYGAAHLKGKEAEFTVTVKEVRAPDETVIDDALAERLGLSSLDTLKDALRANLISQYSGASRFKLKRALLDKLDEAHDFPLPPKMVEAEFSTIWSQVQADKEAGRLPAEDAEKSDEQLQTEYRKIAERRVRLGLVLAEIGRRQEVTVSDQEVTQAMQQEAINMARQFGAQPQEIFDMLRRNPNAAAQIRAPLYEEKVVEKIFDLAKIEDEPVSKDELMKEDDLPEGYGE